LPDGLTPGRRHSGLDEVRRRQSAHQIGVIAWSSLGAAVGRLTHLDDAAGDRSGRQELNCGRDSRTCGDQNRFLGENQTGIDVDRQTYVYNPAGNRTLKIIDSALTSYRNDVANQLMYGELAVGPTYTFNAAGSRQSEQSPRPAQIKPSAASRLPRSRGGKRVALHDIARWQGRDNQDSLLPLARQFDVTVREVDPGFAGAVPQSQKHLLAAEFQRTNGALDDRITVVETVSIPRPLKDSPDHVPLLAMGHTIPAADGRHDWRGISRSGTIDCDFGTFRECRQISRGIVWTSSICQRGPY
jgi:hypothetical protein